MEAAPGGMTDLEERLVGPDGEAVSTEVLKRLDELAGCVTSETAKGLPPDTFKTYDALGRSLAAARAIVIASRNFRTGKEGSNAHGG